MRVVTIAIRTMIVKSVGRMIPRSRPMFRMISSIRPRAFISVPTPSASFGLAPARRAAPQQATPFPKIAAARTTSARPIRAGVETRPIFVFSPE